MKATFYLDIIKEEMMKDTIAITDVETSGLSHNRHEILEIGLVVVRIDNLEIVDELDVKIQPMNISGAETGALWVNGYNEADWQNALTLHEAMSLYAPKVEGAIFSSYNVPFDFKFIETAAKKTNIQLILHERQIDILNVARKKLAKRQLPSHKLSAVSNYFGLGEEPLPHRAINGARKALEVYKKLKELK